MQTDKLRSTVRALRPLIHCITNPISINQCANVILAAGARPMMAEHPGEAALITKSAGAVMLNLGNFTDIRGTSMRISAETAAQHGIPFLLDVCGAACLPGRRDYALRLAGDFLPAVIKGNYSEITALHHSTYSASGVDADSSITQADAEQSAAALARRLGTVILASGQTDIVTDGKRLIRIRNGTPQLASVTGTGCMQGALCAAYLSAGAPMDAAAAACTVFGICGELAETDKGSGTFSVLLMDALSTVTDSVIQSCTEIEETAVETA